MAKVDNIQVGQQYGRLLVIGEPVVVKITKPRNRKVWGVPCQCSCHREESRRLYLMNNLLAGNSTSCGCLRQERSVAVTKTHGQTNTRLYRIWQAMRNRCQNRKCEDWPDYGGRGVTVCPEWEDFSEFGAWANTNGYIEHLTLERRDIDAGYCPANCTWITNAEQANNRRTSVWLTAFGETKTMLDWSNDPRCVVEYGTLQSRIAVGRPIEESITTPSRLRKPISKVEQQWRNRARWATKEAIRKGLLVKADHCQYPGCDTTTVSAHHHNGYARECWFDVIWLCPVHHKRMDYSQTHETNDRSEGAIGSCATWSQQEMDFVKANYLHMTSKEMAANLLGRTPKNVVALIQRLKLQKQRQSEPTTGNQASTGLAA